MMPSSKPDNVLYIQFDDIYKTGRLPPELTTHSTLYHSGAYPNSRNDSYFIEYKPTATPVLTYVPTYPPTYPPTYVPTYAPPFYSLTWNSCTYQLRDAHITINKEKYDDSLFHITFQYSDCLRKTIKASVRFFYNIQSLSPTATVVPGWKYPYHLTKQIIYVQSHGKMPLPTGRQPAYESPKSELLQKMDHIIAINESEIEAKEKKIVKDLRRDIENNPRESIADYEYCLSLIKKASDDLKKLEPHILNPFQKNALITRATTAIGDTTDLLKNNMASFLLKIIQEDFLQQQKKSLDELYDYCENDSKNLSKMEIISLIHQGLSEKIQDIRNLLNDHIINLFEGENYFNIDSYKEKIVFFKNYLQQIDMVFPLILNYKNKIRDDVLGTMLIENHHKILNKLSEIEGRISEHALIIRRNISQPELQSEIQKSENLVSYIESENFYSFLRFHIHESQYYSNTFLTQQMLEYILERIEELERIHEGKYHHWAFHETICRYSTRYDERKIAGSVSDAASLSSEPSESNWPVIPRERFERSQSTLDQQRDLIIRSLSSIIHNTDLYTTSVDHLLEGLDTISTNNNASYYNILSVLKDCIEANRGSPCHVHFDALKTTQFLDAIQGQIRSSGLYPLAQEIISEINEIILSRMTYNTDIDLSSQELYTEFRKLPNIADIQLQASQKSLEPSTTKNINNNRIKKEVLYPNASSRRFRK